MNTHAPDSLSHSSTVSQPHTPFMHSADSWSACRSTYRATAMTGPAAMRASCSSVYVEYQPPGSRTRA